MRESTLSLAASDAAETRAIGARLAAAVLVADPSEPLLIALSGELGAGKTTLVGGLLAALGHPGPVRSPTYTLIESYRLADRDVHHCDLYRLRDPDELDDLGLRDLLAARGRAAGRVARAGRRSPASARSRRCGSSTRGATAGSSR